MTTSTLSPSPKAQPTREQIIECYTRAAANQLKARTSILAQIESFEPDWMTGAVHKEICAHLDGVITLVERGAANPGECSGGPRLILQTPPGIGKTLMSGVHLVSHMLGRHPDWQVIYATYNFDKAAEVGRDTRLRLRDPRYAQIFPSTILDTSAQSMDYFLTDRGGKATFTGIGGGALGKRAHIMVIDDPFNGPEEGRVELHQKKVYDWVLSTARSRLHPFGALIVIHQRWHVADLIGKLLDDSKKNPDGDQWCDCRYPMVAEIDERWRRKGDSVHKERFSNDWCRKTQASVPEWTWSAMYQQKPTLDTGMLFRREWFKNHLIAREKLPKNLRWYLTTDFASTHGRGDHSVNWAFGVDEHDNVYYETPYWAQVDPHVAHANAFDQMKEREIKTVFVEKGGLWNAGKGEYRRLSEKRSFYPRIVEFNRISSKAEHAAGLINHMAAGKVYFIDEPFTENIIIPQFMAFTGERGVSEEDDLVDAAYLPYLTWKEVRRPAKKACQIDLPVIDPDTQAVLDSFEPKKDTSRAWCAGDE